MRNPSLLSTQQSSALIIIIQLLLHICHTITFQKTIFLTISYSNNSECSRHSIGRRNCNKFVKNITSWKWRSLPLSKPPIKIQILKKYVKLMVHFFKGRDATFTSSVLLSESLLGRGKASDLVIDVCLLIIVESSV